MRDGQVVTADLEVGLTTGLGTDGKNKTPIAPGLWTANSEEEIPLKSGVDAIGRGRTFPEARLWVGLKPANEGGTSLEAELWARLKTAKGGTSLGKGKTLLEIISDKKKFLQRPGWRRDWKPAVKAEPLWRPGWRQTVMVEPHQGPGWTSLSSRVLGQLRYGNRHGRSNHGIVVP